MVTDSSYHLLTVYQGSCWVLPLGDPTVRLGIGHYGWETETQRGEVTNSGSHSMLVVEPGFEPGTSMAVKCVCAPITLRHLLS